MSQFKDSTDFTVQFLDEACCDEKSHIPTMGTAAAMTIRTATRKDVPQLTLLKEPNGELHSKKSDDTQLKRWEAVERGDALYLVAAEGDRIVGHVFLELCGIPTEPGYPNLSDLFVAEDKRNRGIGSALVNAAELAAKNHGFAKLSLAVNPRLNPRARTLYERLGFRQTATKMYVDGIYDGVEDWVIDMVKEL